MKKTNMLKTKISFKEFFTDKDKRKKALIKMKRFFLGMNTSDGLLYKAFIFLLVLILGFLFLYPIISMIVTSLMPLSDLADTTVRWVPSRIELNNFKVAMEELAYFSTLGRTMVIVLIPSLINMIIGALTAYGFAKYKFPLKNILFVILLATFIIPKKLTFIPQYAYFQEINLLGSLWTYILPSLFGQGINSALYVLVLYSSFKLIPKQLEESAQIDGANSVQIFFKIVLPLIIPTMITVFLFSFVWYWNDSNTASMYLSHFGTSKWTTLLVKLTNYQNTIDELTRGGPRALLYRGNRAAATLLSILPLMILYLTLQKYFVESVEKSGITGE